MDFNLFVKSGLPLFVFHTVDFQYFLLIADRFIAYVSLAFAYLYACLTSECTFYNSRNSSLVSPLTQSYFCSGINAENPLKE